MLKLLVLVAAAAGLAAVTPAVAQGPTVTLSIGKPSGGPQGEVTTVLFGELVRLSGSISSGRPGETILVTVSPYRGAPGTRTLVTDAEGEFSFVHRPRLRTSYQARWGTRESAQEPFTHVRPKVGLRIRNARRGQFTVTMAADPTHVSRVVVFQRRVSRTAWATVRRVRLPGRNLSARFTARLPRGTHRVRILVPQTPGYLRATSAFVLVRR